MQSSSRLEAASYLEPMVTRTARKISWVRRHGASDQSVHTDLRSYYLEEVLQQFPYYNDFNAFWDRIPSFNSELISSKPNAGHSEKLCKIVTAKNSKADSEAAAADEEGGDSEKEIIEVENNEIVEVRPPPGPDRLPVGKTIVVASSTMEGIERADEDFAFYDEPMEDSDMRPASPKVGLT